MKTNFRQVEKEDLALLRDWRNEEQLRRLFREYRLLNMLNQMRWFEHISISKLDDMFIVLMDDAPVGICGLTHINWKDRSAEISYYLGKKTNSVTDVALGIGVYDFLKKKCFDEYNLNRLWGEAWAFNQGGIKLALKCGFKQEGVLRQTVFWDGKYWDSVIVSILAEEYYKNE
ncbi:hypothetical protein A3J90_06985 [candidate division WOR-1 bacterium RIFOXYC2_FULL_37_10]|uniref:N-acetyltransferase domain-containing protein n=1 Tax=candidate division WOR-1 bacterium RIFOXYB2_FULL_37_13 TaxID=1802579 RepID=A0A1F4SQ76_UNCSA|nr:MAG: hypothetical protein A2310_07550 [candidate division WOR-1 bacterium RIFOXYB2_FULL_37_13]OGC34228.1 MAG: hypothetical protein A3J90_06985 [candidate division WOR-1 bacterium RIFOXYC2_FULL_37_10]